MMRVLMLVTLLFTTAEAQNYQRLVSAQDVAERLQGVRVQLLYVTPVIENKAIAEAIRRAAVERGVKVYLLVAPDFVEAPGSYTASLAALEGVRVRMAQVERSFAILDVEEAAVVLEGSLLGSGSASFLQRASYAVNEGEVMAERSGLFAGVWEEAAPYLSLVERLDSPELESEAFDWDVLGGL